MLLYTFLSVLDKWWHNSYTVVIYYNERNEKISVILHSFLSVWINNDIIILQLSDNIRKFDEKKKRHHKTHFPQLSDYTRKGEKHQVFFLVLDNDNKKKNTRFQIPITD